MTAKSSGRTKDRSRPVSSIISTTADIGPCVVAANTAAAPTTANRPGGTPGQILDHASPRTPPSPLRRHMPLTTAAAHQKGVPGPITRSREPRRIASERPRVLATLPCRRQVSIAPHCREYAESRQSSGELGYGVRDIDTVAARKAAQNNLTGAREGARTKQHPNMPPRVGLRRCVEQRGSGPHQMLYVLEQCRKRHCANAGSRSGKYDCSPEACASFA